VGIAQLEGLLSAIQTEQQVASFRFVGGLPGLDADTVARRLNDCARIVFVPLQLPTFATGRPVSLDARAQLIFAADPNAAILAPYAFKLSSNDATVASPSGFADVEGNYTSVVTPLAAAPVFEVEACAVPSINGLASVFCGRQTVGLVPSAVVLAGRITVNRGSGGNTVRGTVDFRVRVDLDGTLTVVEAIGQVTETTTFQGQCRPSPDAPITEVTLQAQTVDTVTQGKFFLPVGRPAEITAFGPGVRTAEGFVDPSNSCAVVSSSRSIVDSDSFSSTSSTAIELGADGLPTVISFSAGGYSGQLLRE
jgi:hypothetical protein